MKVLVLLLLSLLTFTNMAKEKITTDEYLDEVHKAYEYYEVVIQDSTSSYELTIVRGTYKNKSYYGICFVNVNNNNNKINIIYEDARYEIANTDTNNNCKLIGMRSDNVIKVVLRQNGQDEILATLNIFLPSSFDKEKAMVGLGEGIGEAELKIARISSPIITYAIYSSIGIIALSLIAILLLFIFKKGFFNKEKRKIGIINMEEIYNEPSSNIDEKEFTKDIEEDISNNPLKEDEYEIKDVKSYLKELGFNTNYSLLDENEKNQIMLKLMYLKDNKKISLNDYYQETKELWKE